MNNSSTDKVYIPRARTCCNTLGIAQLYRYYFILTTVLFFLIAASVAHSAPNQPNKPLKTNLYKNAKVITSQNSQSDIAGRIRHKRFVRLDEFKYPLIRLDETLQLSPKELKVLRNGKIPLDKIYTGENTADEDSRIISHQAMVADHILISLHEGVDQKALKTICKKLGAKILRKLGRSGMYLVSLDQHTDFDSIEKAIQAFENESAYIKFAEPDYMVYTQGIPDDTEFGSLWGMNNTGQDGGVPDADIDAPEAWDITTGSRNVLVSILDTGIDYTHPDLVPNIWTNPGEIAGNGIDDDNNGYIDDIHGWDFYNYDNDPFDDNGHGTHCAGTIGAVGNNTEGVAGVNWQVSMAGVKIFNAYGGGALSDIILGIEYATTINSDIMSNSWGWYSFPIGLLIVVTEADNAGILFIVASGNDSVDNDAYPDYPSGFFLDNVISVGASTNMDELSDFSNYGLETVDLIAPGSDIYSTVPGGGYDYKSGTSMAAPHVSGACALLMASEPGLSMLEVKDRLFERADRLPGLYGKIASMRRLNVNNMVNPGWTPPPTQLLLQPVVITDPDGNNNNYPEPSEVINLEHSFLNLGLEAAENVSLEISCSNPEVTVLAPTTILIGSISGYDYATQTGPFQMLLGSNFSKNEEVLYTLTLRYDPDYEEVFNLSFFVLPGDDYELDDELMPTTRSITFGETQEHSIHRIGDTDWATFFALSGRDITIQTSGPGDDDTEMWLFGPGVDNTTNLVAYDDNGNGSYARILCHGSDQLERNLYYLKITQKDNQATIDNYTLSIFEPVEDIYEPDNLPPEEDTISLGDLQEDHSIHIATDVDMIRFTLDEMREIKIETDGISGGDTLLALYGPDDPYSLIGYDDDSGNDYYSKITRTSGQALWPGTYYAEVTGWVYNPDTGERSPNPIDSYSISVEAYNEPLAVPVATPAAAAPGQEVTFLNPDSNDPDGDDIFAWEWTMAGEPVLSSSFTRTFEAIGIYEFSLRAQNVFGVWSQPTTVEVEVAYSTSDIDRNGVVDLDDFVLFRNAFGSNPSLPNWNPDADINGDGFVNLADFVILRNNFSVQDPPPSS